MEIGRHSVPYLRFDYAGQRTVYISAAAAVSAGVRNDLYSDGEVLALVSTPNGGYIMSEKPHTHAKFINSRRLVSYLKAKFPGCSTIAAWTDPEHSALLFGTVKRRPSFDRNTFHKLDLGTVHSFRCSLAHDDRFYVTRAEPLYCVPLAAGDLLYLQNSQKQGLCRFVEASCAFYRSKALVSYCKSRWKNREVFKRAFDDGTLLSPDFSFLAEAQKLPCDLAEIPLDAAGRPTLGICRDYSVQLSQDAYALLGTSVDIYLSHSSVALQPTRQGALHFRRCAGGASTFNLPLARMILAYYPMAEELHLESYHDLYVLSTGDGDFSPRDYFFRVAPEERKCAPPLSV